MADERFAPARAFFLSSQMNYIRRRPAAGRRTYIHGTCFLWQRDPVAGIGEPPDEVPEDGVLLPRPRPSLHARLVAAGRPPH